MYEVTIKLPDLFKEPVTVKCKKVETSTSSSLLIKLEDFEEKPKSDLIIVSSSDLEYFKDCKSLTLPYQGIVSIKEFKTDKEINKSRLTVLGGNDD